MINQKKINITVIGAGRAAHSLVHAAKKAGYNVQAVISRKIDSAKKLAEKNKINFYSDNLTQIPSKINFFILAVPDNEIKSTAKKLSMLKIKFSNSLFIHLSGSLNISELNALKNKGADTASIHIMQTFPERKIYKIKNSFAAVEAEKTSVIKFLFHFAETLGLNPFEIKTKDKILYHLIGVYASNFLAANLFAAEALFDNISGNKNNLHSIIQPIILSTLKNIKKNGAANAISGPAARGEVKVIENHLRELKKRAGGSKDLFNGLAKNYASQTNILLKALEEKKGSLTEDQEKIKKILASFI